MCCLRVWTMWPGRAFCLPALLQLTITLWTCKLKILLIVSVLYKVKPGLFLLKECMRFEHWVSYNVALNLYSCFHMEYLNHVNFHLRLNSLISLSSSCSWTNNGLHVRCMPYIFLYMFYILTILDLRGFTRGC